MEAIPVLLTLSGSAHGGAVEEEERVDLMTTGLLYPLKEGWKLTYTETQPDDDATSDITLLIGKGRVLMSRSGDYVLREPIRPPMERCPWRCSPPVRM